MTPAEYKTQSATQEVNSQGNVNMYVVLKVCIIYFVGDWSNGMIGVSETFENEGFCASSSSRVITGVIKEISYESIKLDSMIFFYLPKTELSRILIFIRRKKILDSSYTDYFS